MRRMPTQYHQGGRGGSFAPLAQDEHDHELEDGHETEVEAGEERISGQHRLSARERFQHQVQQVIRQSSLTHEDQQYEPVQLHNEYAAPLASPRLAPEEFHEIDIAELAGTYVEYYGPRAPSSLSKESDAPTESTYVDDKDKFFCHVYETPMVGIDEKSDPLPTNRPPRDFTDYRPFVLKSPFSLFLLLLLATLLGLMVYSAEVLPTKNQLLSSQNSTSNQSDAVPGLRLRGLVPVRLYGRVEQNSNSTQPEPEKEQPGEAQPQVSSSSTAAASPPVKSTPAQAIPTPEETPATTEVAEPSPPPEQHTPSSTKTPSPPPVNSPPPGDGDTPQPSPTPPEPQPAPTNGDGGGGVQPPPAPPDTTKDDTAEPAPTEKPGGPDPTQEPAKVCTVTNVVTITKTTTLPEVTVKARDLPGLGSDGDSDGLVGGPGLGDIFGRGPGIRTKRIAVPVTSFIPRQIAGCASTTTIVTTTETTVTIQKTVTAGTPETTPDAGLPVVTTHQSPPAPVETGTNPGGGDPHGSKGPSPPNTPVENTTPVAEPGHQPTLQPQPTPSNGKPPASDKPTPPIPIPAPTLDDPGSQPTPQPQPTPGDDKPKNPGPSSPPIETPAPGPDDPDNPVHPPSPLPTPGDGKSKTPDKPHPPVQAPTPTPVHTDPETKPGHQAPPTPSPGDGKPEGPDQPEPPVQTPRPTPDPDSPDQTPPPRPNPPVQTPTPNPDPPVQPPTPDPGHPFQTPTPNPGNPVQIPNPTPNPNTPPAGHVSPPLPPKPSATPPVDQEPNPGNTPPLQQQPTPPLAADTASSTIRQPLATSDPDDVPPPVLGVVPTPLPATNTPAPPPQKQKPEEEPDDEPLRPFNTPPPPSNKPGDEPLRPLNTPPPQLKMPEGTPLPPHTITVVVATEVDQHSTMTSTSTETTTDAIGAVFTEEHITTLDVVQKVVVQTTMVYTDWTETRDFMTLLYTTLTDAAGNPTATRSSLVNMAPFLTTYTDAEGRPTSTGTAWHQNQWRVRTTTNGRGGLTTETYASMTTTSTMMNEWGRATGTTTMVVIETLAVTTMYDSNNVPTRTKTMWEPVTMMTTTIVTPTSTSNSSRNSLNTASLSAFNISSKDYFVGLVLPPLLAVAVSIPVRILDQTAKLYQPFHALTSKYGAETVDSLCLESNSLLGFVTGVRSLMRHHVLLSVTGLLLLINAILIPLSAEAFRISVRGPDCSPQTTASSHCDVTVQAVPTLVSIAIALLSVMMLLVVVTAATLRKWKSGVWRNPWNIEMMGQLAANQEFRGLIKKFEPKNNSAVITNKDAIKTLGQRRFGLNGWYDNYGWNYGIVIKNDAGSLPRNHKRKVGFSNRNTPAMRSKAMPFRALGLWGRLLALLLLVALLVTSLVYISTGANSKFEHFMDGDSFGVRFLFCGVGVVVSLYWATFFNAVAFLSPYRLYRKHFDIASVLTPPTNAYSGLWEVCRRRRPDIYLGLVAFTAILSDVLPILLANVPSKALQASTAHFVCTWFAAAILSLMLVVITGSFLVDWPSMSMNPSKVAGAMYFAQDPGTFLGGYAARSSTPGGRSSQV